MSKRRVDHRVAVSILAFAVVVFAVFAVADRPATAGPILQCGPSTIWDCTMKNGTHQLVGGTICEIKAYQKKTGATCVPSGL